MCAHVRRAMREGEVHGKDYIFVSRAEFESWVEGDQLLEHAVVYGDYKGIPKQQVADALDQGTDVVMRIDVQGAATIRRLLPHSIFVFLVRPLSQQAVNYISLSALICYWIRLKGGHCVVSESRRWFLMLQMSCGVRLRGSWIECRLQSQSMRWFSG